jgi:hypothetical protein
MNTKLTSLVTAAPILLARSFSVILGCIAVWWGSAVLPTFWQDASIERIATQIIAGDTFKAETLDRQLPVIDSIKTSAYCRPAALRSAAIIQLRVYEVETSTKDRLHPDEYLKSLRNVILSSLSCAPADPFMWLALYSVEVTANGFKSDYLKYLRLSYRLGPHEGWIVLKRSPLVFAAFQQLSPDLRENAINEFFAMLRDSDSDFASQAAEILIGPAWPQRELILSHLSTLSDVERRHFEDALYQRGYDLSVPGVGLAPRDSHRFAPAMRVPQ